MRILKTVASRTLWGFLMRKVRYSNEPDDSHAALPGHHEGKGHNFNFPLPMIGVTDELYLPTYDKVPLCFQNKHRIELFFFFNNTHLASLHGRRSRSSAAGALSTWSCR